METRIVVTGFGGLTAVGNNITNSWNAIKNGKTGIAKIKGWDTTDWEYNLGAEIAEFDPKEFIDRKLLKLLSRHDVIGLSAVDQAVKHSEVLNYRDALTDPTVFNERTGIYVASPGSKFSQQYDFFPLLTSVHGNLKRFGEELNSIVHPMWLLRTLPNNVLAYTGIQYGFKGANQNIINHSVGGIQAILEACYAIKRGIIDRAVVIGYDTMTDPQTLIYYEALGVLSKQGVKPFDEKRDGTVLGEGAGALIIESIESANSRNATIYGEIVSGSHNTEAMGIFSIREDGAGLEALIKDTLHRSQLKAGDIGMIIAHGNGNILSDSVEAKVFASIFEQTPITAFKWALGHTFAAAGIIETILTLLALQEKSIPGISTLEKQAKDCSSINVAQKTTSFTKSKALVVNRGFGSINSCLTLTTCEQ